MSTIDEPSPKERVFMSPDAFRTERIFPIRNSVGEKDIGIEQKRGQNSQHEAANIRAVKGDRSIAPTTPNVEYKLQPWPEIPLEDNIRKLGVSIPDPAQAVQDDTDSRMKARPITQRSQMVPEKHGGIPGVVYGELAGTTQAAFHRCEDEPIHTPGAIQQHGALVALRYNENRELLVRICSENTAQILQRTPEDLFDLLSFIDILAVDQRELFLARVDHILGNELGVADTGLDIFTLSLASQDKNELPIWCAMHLSIGTKDLLICEFEARNKDLFSSATGIQTLPRVPIRTLDNPLIEGERLKSITDASKPIRVLEAAREQYYSIGFIEMFSAMSQVQQQLGSAQNLQDLLDVVVGLVHQMTHFHRIMVYRFDQYKNGAVDAEFVDPRASDDLFRGLHFPASDIPKQARELYKINKIRVLLDRDQETARLVCREDADFAKPLDLTQSYLRAMSPIHLKYLANMGVRSSLSISLMIDDDLWGLIACHSYGDTGIPVSLPIRELCRNIGECASINIDRLLMISRLTSKTPLAQAPPQQNPSAFVAASSADLLRIFDADFGLLSIQDEARAIGRLEPYSEALALLTHIQKQKLNSIVASENIIADFPSLAYPPGIKSIAGLLIVPLSMFGTDFIVFFRRGQLKEVRWAGNPYEKLMRSGTTEYLEPRRSFRRWTEMVVGTSREWTVDQLEAASILSLLYGKFIEVWRQKELVVQKGLMNRLLIRNSSHEVRTPLNAIVNYLEIALENALDEDTREALLKAHKASRSLIYVINDLLSLTKVDGGQMNDPNEAFDPGSTISEVLMTFRSEAIRKGLDLTMSIHQGLPKVVKGDPARLRQSLSNVMSNAFQHTADGGIKVDIYPVQVKEKRSIIRIIVQDVGIGMSDRQLDELFQEFEQILDESEAPRSADTPALGVGLAVVARYVRNLNGQIKIRSEPNKGTIFTFELPFDHAPCNTITEHNLPRPLHLLPTPPIAHIPGSYTSEISEMDASPESSNYPSPLSPATISSPYSRPGHQRVNSIDMTLNQNAPGNISSTSKLSGRGLSDLGSSSSNRTTSPFLYMANFDADMPKLCLSVLVAEDNPVNARVLQRRLEKSGHRVQVTPDGQSCFDLYKSSPDTVDIILMDLQVLIDDSVYYTPELTLLDAIDRWSYIN